MVSQLIHNDIVRYGAQWIQRVGLANNSPAPP